MENLRISPQARCYRINRCGTEVLRISAPSVTGTTPAAAHAAALVEALVERAQTSSADDAEQTLREAIANGALLRFSRHDIKITLTAPKSEHCLHLVLTLTHKSGDTVLKNGTLHTYWSTDERLQYARAPRARRKKNCTFFARHLAHARKM